MTLRVLTVDDSRTILAMLHHTLSNAGFEVLQAEDGKQGLDVLRTETVDVVITDINMPRMDGHALARQLRDDGNPVPVIGATANATAEERERCLASGMQGYLSKPIDIARLRKALTALRQGDPA